MFSIWNSTIQEICNWIQVAGNYRCSVVLNRVYKAFFHCEDFLHCPYGPDQILLATFMLALKIKFERALYIHDEGYEISHDHDLPKPLNKSTHISAVPSAAIASFQPHNLPETNDTHLSINPKMKTTRVPTTSGILQMIKH